MNRENEQSREKELPSTNSKERSYNTTKQDLKPLNLSKNTNKAKRIKFFGFKFMAIWVFPMAALGIIMEFLFISPIRGVPPFS